MRLGDKLRQWSVGQRISMIVLLLFLPLAGLSLVSVWVLNQEEMAFRDTVDESVRTLLPLHLNSFISLPLSRSRRYCEAMHRVCAQFSVVT